MYCPNCGKEVKQNDNFCRYCGANLKQDVVEIKSKTTEKFSDDDEEIVLYEVEKHWMNLVVPAFLIPLFLLYFWNIFLNTHSFFSWVAAIALIALILYPIVRYKSDSMIITNRYIRIKCGIINTVECDIPINSADFVEVVQSTMGKMFDYCLVSYIAKNERFSYGYVKAPKDLQYIIENPQKFIEENAD